MLISLLLLSAPASAMSCDWLESDRALGSPSAGTLPPGFAVRPDGRSLPQMQLLAGERAWGLEYTSNDASAPEDLPLGSYELTDTISEESVTVEVVDDWTPIAPDEDLVLSAVQWDKEWDKSDYLVFCRNGSGRRHTQETLSFSLPAAQQTGWHYKVEDPSTSLTLWMGLHEEPRAFSWTQDIEPGGKEIIRQDRCMTWGLYDPLGQLEREGEFPCESRAQAPGCSSTPGSSGLLGGALILALLGFRRRRA